MITESYLAQQKALHAKGNYGVSGHKYAETVRHISQKLDTHDILDYGCGQRTLEKALGFLIRNYDPAIEEFSDPPGMPADVVVCSDVLEHIEPDQLDAVLDDLKRLMKKMGLFVIATGPAKKVLDDGRNAHLIQEGPDWWLPKLMQRFELLQCQTDKHSFAVLISPKVMQ
jgi:hypothetical protein